MNQNNQAPDRINVQPSGALSVHHIFPTLQGEGPFAGTPAIFVRLAGCNLQCPLCDTDYTSKRETIGPVDLFWRVDALTSQIPRRQGPLVVITGGEPFRQNLLPFIRELLNHGYRVQVETNGTLCNPGFPFNEVTVVCSPKTPKINGEIARHAHAFKYVVEAGKFDPATGIPLSALGGPMLGLARPHEFNKHAEIFIQPLDAQDKEKNQANLNEAVSICLGHGYRLCIQTHKLVNLE